MWNEIAEHVLRFETAVLSGVDDEGYPYSIRCRPELDAEARVVRIQVPDYTGIQPGPAGLLCHVHDERLWNLRNLGVRGTLERDERGWLLRPERFVPGTGMGGFLAQFRTFLNFRKAARRYVERRGWPIPQVKWDEYDRMWEDVKRNQEKYRKGMVFDDVPPR